MKNLYKIKNDLYMVSNTEQIKIDDYITDGYVVWQWKDDSSLLGRKKVILSTDQDLIKDGVQAIDDEFLEWFVKNPNCEFVKIVDDVECLPMPNIHIHKHIYKIIIPQVEPKQLTDLEVAMKLEEIEREEPKKETLSGFEEGPNAQLEWLKQNSNQPKQEKNYSEAAKKEERIFNSTMMKQTAVEWLIDQMLNQDWYTYKSLEYIEQAKEMEKQQIIEAWIATDNPLQRMSAEQYYKETFKK